MASQPSGFPGALELADLKQAVEPSPWLNQTASLSPLTCCRPAAKVGPFTR